jgi:hypothetical protein
MRQSALAIALFLVCTSYSQTKETEAFSKVKSIYLKKSLGCVRKNGQCSIYLNRSENSLDIIGDLIPLLSVTVKYTETNLVPNVKHFVVFRCESSNCISNSDKEANNQYKSVGVPFGSKQDCYDFIDAIAELKAVLEK